MSRLLPRVGLLEAPAHVDAPARHVHPGAWWVWAIGTAIAASLTANLPVLVLVAGALVVVVFWRGRDRRALRFYLALATVIVIIRLGFQVILGGSRTGTVLFRLPEVRLTDWAAGIRLGGPVTVEALVLSGTDAVRLSVLILAVGAAMSLADPRTVLRSVPAALHDISVAIVITLTVLPQIIASAIRINRGRRLRGSSTRGLRRVVGTLVPVLEDSVESSMALATSMEVRGYGRTRQQRRVGLATTLALLSCLALLGIGLYVLLGVPRGTWPAIALLGLGTAGGAIMLARSSKRLSVTRYRPAPWGPTENLLLLLAAAIVATAIWADGPVRLVTLPALVLAGGAVGRPR